MSEPTTEAGRALLELLHPLHAMSRRAMADGIAAIEAEARATAEAQRDRALIELDRLIGVIQSGIDERGVLNAASKAEAALAATPASSRFLDLDAPDAIERLAAALNETVGHGWIRATPASPVEEWLVNAAFVLAVLRREPGVVDSAGDDRPAPAHAVEAEKPTARQPSDGGD